VNYSQLQLRVPYTKFLFEYSLWQSQSFSLNTVSGRQTVPEEPVCIDLFRQNPVLTSLHLKHPVHVLPPLVPLSRKKLGTSPKIAEIVDLNPMPESTLAPDPQSGTSDFASGYIGWRAGTTTLIHSRLYPPPVRDFEFGYWPSEWNMR
jgi:hypothetical protein